MFDMKVSDLSDDEISEKVQKIKEGSESWERHSKC